jgi:hypothetical protein
MKRRTWCHIVQPPCGRYYDLAELCIAKGLTPEIPAKTWTLLGFCVSTNDQLNGDAGDLTKVNPSRHHPDGG